MEFRTVVTCKVRAVFQSDSSNHPKGKSCRRWIGVHFPTRQPLPGNRAVSSIPNNRPWSSPAISIRPRRDSSLYSIGDRAGISQIKSNPTNPRPHRLLQQPESFEESLLAFGWSLRVEASSSWKPGKPGKQRTWDITDPSCLWDVVYTCIWATVPTARIPCFMISPDRAEDRQIL